MSIDIRDLTSKTPNVGIGIGAKARSLGICLIFAGVDEPSMQRITPAQSALDNEVKNEPKKHVNIIRTKSIGDE
jgi:hypothetical protein